MCGRFALDDRVDAMVAEWVLAKNAFPDWWQPSWNIPPGHTVPVLLSTSNDGGTPAEPTLLPGLWSFLPPWAREPRLKFPTFNARAETLTSTRTWAPAVPSRRCVIPATAYYEWSGSGSNRRPYVVTADDGAGLAFAGLYSWWRRDDSDPWQLTATIITRASVGPVSELHDRTPLILPPHAVSDWIDPTVRGDAAYVEDVVQGATPRAESLRFAPVAPLRGDGPELLKPLP